MAREPEDDDDVRVDLRDDCLRHPKQLLQPSARDVCGERAVDEGLGGRLSICRCAHRRVRDNQRGRGARELAEKARLAEHEWERARGVHRRAQQNVRRRHVVEQQRRTRRCPAAAADGRVRDLDVDDAARASEGFLKRDIADVLPQIGLEGVPIDRVARRQQVVQLLAHGREEAVAVVLIARAYGRRDDIIQHLFVRVVGEHRGHDGAARCPGDDPRQRV